MEVGCLLGGCLALEESVGHSWRRVLSPRWHGHTWLLAWRLVLDLRMLGLREWSCRCGGPEGAHGFGGALELWGLWRRSVGHIFVEHSCLGALLVDVFTLELDMCHLERECSTCEPTCVELGCL
jgi:hypothetical protein